MNTTEAETETKKRKMDNSDTGANRAASSSANEWPDVAASGAPVPDNDGPSAEPEQNAGPLTKQARKNKRKRLRGHTSKQVTHLNATEIKEIKSPIGYKAMELIETMDDAEFIENMMDQKKAIILRMNCDSTRDEAFALLSIIKHENYSLTQSARWNLYRLWLKLYVLNLKRQMKYLHVKCNAEKLEEDKLCHQEDIAIAKRAKIVGMTTTGAAKNRHLIDATQPKITSK